LYLEILDYVDKTLKYASKDFETLSESEEMTIRYFIIVIVEALVNFVLHISRRICESEGIRLKPETLKASLQVLRDRNLIKNDELNDIISLVKLRNLLVHRYWIIDDEEIYRNVKSNFTKIINFIKRVCEHVGLQV